MRINVYSQELITSHEDIPEDGNHVTWFSQTAEETADGKPLLYSAVRLYLHSSKRLHHPIDGDDDRSAITFWLPKSQERREFLADSFEELAVMIRNSPGETGLD